MQEQFRSYGDLFPSVLSNSRLSSNLEKIYFQDHSLRIVVVARNGKRNIDKFIISKDLIGSTIYKNWQQPKLFALTASFMTVGFQIAYFLEVYKTHCLTVGRINGSVSRDAALTKYFQVISILFLHLRPYFVHKQGAKLSQCSSNIVQNNSKFMHMTFEA